MKTLRIATMLAGLLLMTGCTTARAMQETPSPTFSSAGTAVIRETKKAAETIQKEALKAAEEAGVEFKFGSEMEFYLFKTDDEAKPTKIPYDEAGYMDIGLNRANFIEMCLPKILREPDPGEFKVVIRKKGA